MTTAPADAPEPVPAALIGTVVLLTGIAPLATDMYVPAFPDVARDLGTSATAVQLTLTTFFVGMALGQLVGGPSSDQRGRRRPLLGAVAVVLLASVACALAPTIATMAVARCVQGFAGGWAMVIGRAVVVDLARGPQLVRSLNLVQGVGGIAPVVAPLLGGAILQFSTWRAPFWALAVITVVTGVAVWAIVPETLPVPERHAGGLRTFTAAAREILGNRDYVGHVLVCAGVVVALFAYVATSAFVLRSMNGLSPIAYSASFAANAGGMTVAALLAARLAGRVRTRTVVLAGQLLALVAGLTMLAGALWLGTPLVLALGCFFALMVAVGLVLGNAGALANDAVPHHPGTGSAVLGLVQWGTAGLAAPVAGLGGEHSAVPVALLMTLGAAASLTALLAVARPAALTTGAGFRGRARTARRVAGTCS
ncbi:multidrug effflux MFS transporter [Kineococcus rhizosphaerae]|uniref:DHA1 family bicyclomycin/chloramphenicol resistance-like MFS transporter n=1 Tax=Kineococcus rhizosphaerae TaxID=559628 RepID=A0A2T0QX68_9ACTN|nr:multidrug effflux MFS transporter [Kineococcus rhizosphaerae]PRY10478.1 DHA1 family bicyclomycin/chloramphenicol resistance-like MFS transporter [Kineococcus rhizosphaerae]